MNEIIPNNCLRADCRKQALCVNKLMPSKVKIISTKELENMHTGSLMSRRKKLLVCEESFEVSDRYGNENKPVSEETGYIEFKNNIVWQKAYKELKTVLSARVL